MLSTSETKDCSHNLTLNAALATLNYGRNGVLMTDTIAWQEPHDEDVSAALSRTTQDGYGTGVLPESDFVAFAEDDAEVEE
jgi:hypothetical protein